MIVRFCAGRGRALSRELNIQTPPWNGHVETVDVVESGRNLRHQRAVVPDRPESIPQTKNWSKALTAAASKLRTQGLRLEGSPDIKGGALG